MLDISAQHEVGAAGPRDLPHVPPRTLLWFAARRNDEDAGIARELRADGLGDAEREQLIARIGGVADLHVAERQHHDVASDSGSGGGGCRGGLARRRRRWGRKAVELSGRESAQRGRKCFGAGMA